MFLKIGLFSFFLLMLSGCVIIADGTDEANTQSARRQATGSYIVRYVTPTKNLRSIKPFDETLDDLNAAITRRGLTIFATIDHADGARSAGMDLAPTTLVIFGNPKAGTALMQANQEVAIGLPLKALVWQNQKGDVMVSVTNIDALSQQYDLSSAAPVMARIDDALTAILEEAVAPKM